MPTIRIPDFSATLYFKRPDRFHIETKSFAPIPRNSGVFNPMQFDPEKNRITYIKSETLAQTRADLYRVEPLDAKSQVRYYHVWVGGVPGRILQVEYLSFRGTKGLVNTLLQDGFPGTGNLAVAGKRPHPPHLSRRRRHTSTVLRSTRATIPFPGGCAGSTR